MESVCRCVGTCAITFVTANVSVYVTSVFVAGLRIVNIRHPVYIPYQRLGVRLYVPVLS